MAETLVQVGDFVACSWTDAHANAKDEYTSDEIDKVTSYKFITYGILVRDDRGKSVKDPLVGVAAEVGEDHRYRGVTFIPVGMITKITHVRGSRRNGKKKSPPLVCGGEDKQLLVEVRTDSL